MSLIVELCSRINYLRLGALSGVVMKPNVFSYLDYKDFLKDCFAWKKEQNSVFSQRYIAHKIGISSMGWFGDIITGRRKLKGEYLSSICVLFDINQREDHYFRLLVEFGQAGTQQAKDQVYSKLLEYTQYKPQILPKESFAFFQNWWHTAIREIIVYQGFDGNYKKLHQKLRPEISMAKVEESVTLLEKLNLIKKVGSGCFEATSEHITKDANSRGLHFYRFTKEYSGAAIQALSEVPKEERDYSSLALVLDEEQFTKVRAEIEALRNRIRVIAETPSKEGKVYQCLFQSFPISSSL